MPNTGKDESERRRTTDPQPVEVSGYSNSAARDKWIQRVIDIGTLFASFSILISVIWWASKVDTQQGITTENVAALTEEAKDAKEERRLLSENLVRVVEVLTKATETLDATVVRLNDTRDIALGRDTANRAAP